jgi:hypothetical protein
MFENVKRPWLIAAALIGLAIAGWCGMAAVVPTVLSPYPGATVLPVIMWSMRSSQGQTLISSGAAMVIPAVLGPMSLLGWHPRLLVGAPRIPTRSVVGFSLLSILAAVYFLFEWPHARTFHTEAYRVGVLTTNVVCISLGWWLLWRARRLGEFRASLLAHTWIVGWLVWQGFPWLGELCC